MASAGDKIQKTDIDGILTTLNKARNKWSLTSITLTNANVGDKALSSHISTLVTGLQQAINSSGASNIVTSDITNYGVGEKIKPNLLTLLETKSTSVYNHCRCNCDRCSCDSQCGCNCNNCCDYCTVDPNDGNF